MRMPPADRGRLNQFVSEEMTERKMTFPSPSSSV